MRHIHRISLLTVVFILLLLASVCAETELPVFNGDFEVLPEGVTVDESLGRLPLGWVVTGGGTHWQIGLSDLRSFDGDYSLRVHVSGEGGGVHVSSKPIPVEPGQEYAVLANVYNYFASPLYTNGVHIYLEFWPEAGWWGTYDYWSNENWKQGARAAWSGNTRVGVAWKPSARFDEWHQVVVSGVAPANAKYATISLWTASRTMDAFVDGIRFAVVE